MNFVDYDLSISVVPKFFLCLSTCFAFSSKLFSLVTTIIGPTFQGGYGDPHPLHSLVKGNAKVRSYAPDEEREANLVILSIIKEREGSKSSYY